MLFHTFVALTSLLGYLIGWSVEFLCCLAIVRKLNYSERGDLVLILSLALGNTIASWSSLLGCMEALLGMQFHKYSAYVLGFGQSVGWLAGAIQMNALAINRFVALFMPLRYDIVCSGRIMARVSVCLWMFACVANSLISTFSYKVIWSSPVVNAVFDYSDNSTQPSVFIYTAQMTLHYSTYVIGISCYSLVIIKLIHKYFSVSATQQHQPDLRLCVQFILIYFVFVLQTKSWNLLSLGGQYWALVSYASVANFTMNGYIYLSFNKLIRGAVKQLLGIKSKTDTTQAAAGTGGRGQMSSRANENGQKLFVPTAGQSKNDSSRQAAPMSVTPASAL